VFHNKNVAYNDDLTAWQDHEDHCGLSKKLVASQVGWCTVVIPELRRLRQEDCEYEVSFSYKVRPCLKKTKGREEGRERGREERNSCQGRVAL
jgi:hypothetical protein